MRSSVRITLHVLGGALIAALICLPHVLNMAEKSVGRPIAYADYPRIEPRGYVCYRAAVPIVIDGKLDDAAWNDAPWSEPFVDIEGDKKPKPKYQTRVKMLWDDQCLYIAAQLEEPHVWATLIRHDSYIFKDDNDFEVFLDPDGDNQFYAELEMNALNTTWDLLLPKPYKARGTAINAWEITGLRTAVHVDGTLNNPADVDRGWTIEIAWPWQGLRELSRTTMPPEDGDQWRINFSRVQWQHEVVGGKYRQLKDRGENNWVWSPQGAIDMHMPERWGVLQFSTATPGTAKYRPPPSAARHFLHQVLHAQRQFQKAKGRWATTFAELAVPGLDLSSVDNPLLELTTSGYEASASERGGRRWHMNSDGRVWAD